MPACQNRDLPHQRKSRSPHKKSFLQNRKTIFNAIQLCHLLILHENEDMLS